MAHQYDRWYQLFTVKDQDGKILVPSDSVVDQTVYRGVQDLSILINDKEYRYSAGTLVPVSGQWRAYIDEEQTDLERILTFQCEADFGDPYHVNEDDPNQPVVIHSDKVNDRLSPSLDWSDDD